MNENTYYAPFDDHQGVISELLDELRAEVHGAPLGLSFVIEDELRDMRASIIADRDALSAHLAAVTAERDALARALSVLAVTLGEVEEWIAFNTDVGGYRDVILDTIGKAIYKAAKLVGVTPDTPRYTHAHATYNTGSAQCMPGEE